MMFEKGLPGYDDWLDNHGNPGIWEGEATIWNWAIEEPIDVTQISGVAYRIQRVNGPEWFDLSFDHHAEPGKTILINGKFYDLGDDAIAFISIADQYYGDGGQFGKTLRQEPFQEEE